MKKLFGFLVIMATLAACGTTQSSSEKAEKEKLMLEQINDSINNRTFTSDFTYVVPHRLRPRYLTGEYRVKLQGDSLISILPYFGVAYRSDYGSTESPLSFNAHIKDYKVTNEKRNRVRVEFKVKNNMELLEYHFDFFANGNVFLDVISSDRESITFRGEIITN